MTTERKDGSTSSAYASAQVERGLIEAGVQVAAPPERVFRELASDEVVGWWVRPGVFDTREWSGDVRAGGSWRAAGVGQGRPYALEGEFLEVDPPGRLVHTWRAAQEPAQTTVTYRLEPVAGGTRITLEHGGFTSPQVCAGTAEGWRSSFQRLEEVLGELRPADG
jgi:uncharacterized protein YndB with AHSA1/START domain